MNKVHLIEQIVTSLTESLGVLEKAARASHEEATHESSKAESKYDTRGLEAAYLAGSQAKQARELEANGTPSTYFIGPRSGGLEITLRRKEIMLITPQSPLGQNLMGRKVGQRWTATLGGSIVEYHIVSIS